MGLFLCNKHGGQGFFEICEHIQADLEKNIYPEMIDVPLLNVKMCNLCYDRISAHELPDTSFWDLMSKEISDDELDKLEETIKEKHHQLNTHLLCLVCDKEKQVEWAKKNGKEPPFDVFENTLTYNEKETVEQLKEHLLAHFNVPQSIVNTDSQALFISLGDISKPLIIQVYYLVEENEQNSFLTSIDDFFLSIEKTQRKIQFMEAEVWIEKKGDGWKSHERGEEILIKEVLIN